MTFGRLPTAEASGVLSRQVAVGHDGASVWQANLTAVGVARKNQRATTKFVNNATVGGVSDTNQYVCARWELDAVVIGQLVVVALEPTTNC